MAHLRHQRTRYGGDRGDAREGESAGPSDDDRLPPVIGFGTPNKQGTEATHGARLGPRRSRRPPHARLDVSALRNSGGRSRRLAGLRGRVRAAAPSLRRYALKDRPGTRARSSRDGRRLGAENFAERIMAAYGAIITTGGEPPRAERPK